MKNKLQTILTFAIALTIGHGQLANSQEAPLAFSKHKLEVADVHTTISSVSTTYSAKDDKHWTSIIFVVEDLSGKNRAFALSNIQFKDASRKIIPHHVPNDGSNSGVSSGSRNSNFSKFRWPSVVAMPAVHNAAKAHVVEEWFDLTVPNNAKYLHIRFCNESFDFPLKQTKNATSK